jgi:L-threonylcarbamoyladenylate synthase
MKPQRVIAADAAGIAEAVRVLKGGGIVGLPTETVYGLAADAANPSAVAKVFRAKGRPAMNPLIVHVADKAMAARYAEISPLASRLIERFWPGPLTLVLPKRADAPLTGAVTAGLPTVALRAPDHGVMRSVIAGLGRGVAAPSANRSGRLSPTRAEHLRDMPVPLVLDGGPCREGLESSIVKEVGGSFVLLRAGTLSADAIAAVAGFAVAPAAAGGAVEAPGMLLQHYAPEKPLRLGATAARPGEYLIGFGAVAGDISLSASGDLREAAANLFAALHAADAAPAPSIAVAPVPDVGPGVAINDRLRRAARG